MNIENFNLSSDQILQTMDNCTKCGICHAYCPVANVTNKFPGPKYMGPQTQRFREVERFATGKNTVTGQFGRNKAAYERNIQKYKRMGKSSTERKIDSFDKQNEDIADYFSNYPNPDDFASGGVAKMLGE